MLRLLAVVLLTACSCSWAQVTCEADDLDIARLSSGETLRQDVVADHPAQAGVFGSDKILY